MAHKDGSGYYMNVVLRENGQTTTRRFQRLTWQSKDGVVHVIEGRALPPDIGLDTGMGQNEKHFATFLGVDVPKEPTWVAYLPSKANFLYVIIGAASVLILKGLLTLAAS